LVYEGLKALPLGNPSEGSPEPAPVPEPAPEPEPTTLVTVPVPAPTPDPVPQPPTGGTIAKYAQCGGTGWAGSGTCVAGTTCKYSNDWYSQCL